MLQVNTIFWVLFLTCTALLSGNNPASADNKPPRFELLHLWATPEEAYALNAFVEPVKQRGVFWSEHAVQTNFIGVRRAYAERLALFAAPTGVFWIGGNDAVSVLISQGTFRSIPFRNGSIDFGKIIRQEVLDVVRYDEENLSLLPIGIHLQNHIIYNETILRQLSDHHPATWEEFLDIARKAKAAGYDAISMSDQRWQVRFLIGSILVEKFEPDEFVQLISQDMTKDSHRANLAEAYRVFRALKDYANTDMEDLAWNDAVGKVVEGKSLANVLGDFSSPLLPEDGNFTCDLPPGNTYVLWSLDTIALTNTIEPDEIVGQDIFTEIVGTGEHNRNYIVRKGGIPAYRNVDTSLLNTCSQQSIRKWDKAEHKFLLSSREWTQSMDIIAGVSLTLWEAPELSIETAVEETIASLRALSTHQDSDRPQ